jgi:cation transport ATPase
VAEAITEGLSIDAVRSDLALDQKFTAVVSARRAVMVARDGINDAPALAVYRAGDGRPPSRGGRCGCRPAAPR